MKNLLNITVKDIFIKYSPMYISLSLIQTAREKYLDKNHINSKLFYDLINLYGVKFDDYKKCYNEIKLELEEKSDEMNENLETERKNKIKIEDKKGEENDNKKEVEPGDFTPKVNTVKMGKTVYVISKMRSNSSLPNLLEDIVKIKTKEEKKKYRE